MRFRLPARKALLILSAVGVAIATLALVAMAQRPSGATPPVSGLALPVVVGAGILDGFNPCSFAGLILFASFALAAAKPAAQVVLPPGGPTIGRRRVLKNGLTYVSGVFLVYVAIGLGFLGVVATLSATHVVGRIAAILTIALGLWTLKDVLVPEWGWRLETPAFLRPRVRTALQATTPVGIFAAGTLVGLCTVPCTGGVYLGILSLLSTQTTYGTGLGYLLLYNVMFVTPLLAVLAVASSRRTLGRISRWHARNASIVKTALGIAIVALGFISLVLLT